MSTVIVILANALSPDTYQNFSWMPIHSGLFVSTQLFHISKNEAIHSQEYGEVQLFTLTMWLPITK